MNLYNRANTASSATPGPVAPRGRKPGYSRRPGTVRVLYLRRGDTAIAFYQGRAVSWPAKAGKPIYTFIQTRVFTGEKTHARWVSTHHKLARALLAVEDTRFYGP